MSMNRCLTSPAQIQTITGHRYAARSVAATKSTDNTSCRRRHGVKVGHTAGASVISVDTSTSGDAATAVQQPTCVPLGPGTLTPRCAPPKYVCSPSECSEQHYLWQPHTGVYLDVQQQSNSVHAISRSSENEQPATVRTSGSPPTRRQEKGLRHTLTYQKILLI